ncbi:MAG: N-6 DNA methylase [Sideroxyarcus sp.]|nr:N-6 DNA methylase [Sideroxyarcus sp.]
MMLNLKTELCRYGAAEGAVKLLDATDDATLLRYVDLFPESATRKGVQCSSMPVGVVEYDDRPLIYLYRADVLAISPDESASVVAGLVRTLACRGEGHYLAVVFPGELVVYPIGLIETKPTSETFLADSARASLLIPELAAGDAPQSLKQQLATARSLHELLFELITSVAQSLRDSKALSITRERDEVLPLVGRAVFARFLIDRGIINARTFPKLYTSGRKPEDAFSTPELAALTCVWLDSKFNGELLPLLFEVHKPTYADYLAFFSNNKVVKGRVLHHLTNVMFRAPNGRLALALSWEGVDFAHVPIGLLSEVYEEYAHQFYRDDALRESVRYTPRHLAEFTIAHAFEGLPEKGRDVARVLDPAAGAGIFLVLALQRLVAERWRATGRRPDTQEIRDILNGQIRGYDINHSALTLAALSLYLTALELDPDPFPPEKLRFDRLMGSVLRNMRAADETYPYSRLVLGSLGELGDPKPKELPFDIVTGNPPWTSFKEWGDTKYDFNDYVRDMVRRILAKRRSGVQHLQNVAKNYEHNDLLPDTAFMWRAIEWAKDGGVIAFIVAGRLLFKRGGSGARVRNSLFQSMRVTGVLNGALLMPLWPQINQPFCIVFARNSVPTPKDHFIFVTPTLDSGPAGQFRMRIDSEVRQPVELKMILERPHLLKVLTRGGRLDVDIVERIQKLARPDVDEQFEDVQQTSLMAPSPVMQSIATYWKEWNNNKKRFGQGYIPPGKKTNTQSRETHLRVLELLRREALLLTSDDLYDENGGIRIGLRVNPRQLNRFTAMKLYRLADPDVFNPPLVLINEGFGESPQGVRARLYLGKAPLVFRRNFYGFSCAGHPKAQQMAKYLFCIINSDLFGYYTLQVSAKFGLERRTLLVEDIEDFPILHALTDRQFNAVEKVADELNLNDPKTWLAMNHCINKLYGLTSADEQVMKDTLVTMMPYKTAQMRARSPAQGSDLKMFRARLESLLQPFFDLDSEKVAVLHHELPVNGWVAFDITIGGKTLGTARDDTATRIAAQLANDEGASRLFHVVGEGHLRVAICNQYRYLTLSRARLCALDSLREHGNVFPIRDDA